MNTNRPQPAPPRFDAYRMAVTFALLTTLLVLMVLKFVTSIAMLPALFVAIVVFVTAFGFKLRMTPFR